MATGAPGSNGVWLYGEDDSETTFSALLNKAGTTVNTQLGADRTRLTSIESVNTTQNNRLTALEAAGRIVNVVQVVKTDTWGTTNGTFTEVTGLSASITPKSASNKILILTQIAYATSGNSTYPDTGHFKVTRAGTDIYIGNAGSAQIRAVFGGTMNGAEYGVSSNSINYMDSPGTTASVTYRVEARRGRASNTVYVNRAWNDLSAEFVTRGASSITLIEVAG